MKITEASGSAEQQEMGLTHAKATVANPANPRRAARFTFLVDSGAGSGMRSYSLKRSVAPSPVIFGERGDSVLVGTVSLEALRLMLDAIKRVLRPLPMVLG